MLRIWVPFASAPVPLTSTLGSAMNVELFLQANILRADLEVADSHFTKIGISDLTGFLHLKSALVTLANLCDLEPALCSTYKEHPEPSAIIKPLRKNIEFSKYLRNKFVGHIHPTLIGKAIEWQPALRHVAADLDAPGAMLMVNLWLLETAINTYVDANGRHKVFGGDTDLMYPPDWKRFVEYLEITIRGGLEYLRLLQALWPPKILPTLSNPFSVELAVKAGQTEFKYLSQ